MQMAVMWWSDIITATSWRAGAKLIHEELGVSVAGDRQPCDVPPSSANDDDAAADHDNDSAADDHDDKQDDEQDNCPQHQQQNKAESDVLLQDLVTITAGNILLHACCID